MIWSQLKKNKKNRQRLNSVYGASETFNTDRVVDMILGPQAH